MSDGVHPGIDPRLAESEERYRAVIQNASDMIQSVRPDGSFEFVNDSWLKALGYTSDEVQDLDIWDIIHTDSRDHCQVLFAKAIEGESIGYMAATFQTKDGHEVPIEGNVTSRFLGDTVVATHGFFRDVSERLRAQELEERNRQLERDQQARYLEKMAALGKLSAGLAHELNNPAAAVQRANAGLAASLARRDAQMRALNASSFDPGEWGAIDTVLQRIQDAAADANALGPLEISKHETAIEDWLEDHGILRGWDIAPGLVEAHVAADHLDDLLTCVPDAALPAVIGWLAETMKIRESIEIIGRSSHRISELVQAVKGYTHMDRATEQYVDVHEGLENTLIILAHRLRNVTITKQFDRTLPAVRAFGNTLNQVWTNILDNAADATEKNGTITIGTHREGDHAVVEITDNGTGIAADDLACIFEPFFTTKPQGQGSGLGLDTAWRIVTEEHGGTIITESVPGRTVFRVSIPISPGE